MNAVWLSWFWYSDGIVFWKNNTVIEEKLQNQSIDVYMKKLSQNGAKWMFLAFFELFMSITNKNMKKVIEKLEGFKKKQNLSTRN